MGARNEHAYWFCMLSVASPSGDPFYFFFWHNTLQLAFCLLLTTTANVLQPLYTPTCVIWHVQLRTGGFCWCKVLLPALADGSQCIRIREKMLEFSTAFSTPSPYHSLLLNMCIIMIEGACSDEALMLHVLPNMILEPYRQNPLIAGRILCITEPYGCLSRLRLSQ